MCEFENRFSRSELIDVCVSCPYQYALLSCTWCNDYVVNAFLLWSNRFFHGAKTNSVAQLNTKLSSFILLYSTCEGKIETEVTHIISSENHYMPYTYRQSYITELVSDCPHLSSCMACWVARQRAIDLLVSRPLKEPRSHRTRQCLHILGYYFVGFSLLLLHPPGVHTTLILGQQKCLSSLGGSSSTYPSSKHWKGH